ncbi:MAG: hypothetical protein LUD84_07320 [Clostridiales bacterium]|nr:hypothetical protein [Clostridiales bacterium]
MEQELPLYENGVLRGHILCKNEGCYMTFLADTPLLGGGVKKVWLFSDSGEKLLLGTLVPEGQRLRLRRRVSHSDLRFRGMAAPTSGQINPQEDAPGWSGFATLPTQDAELAAALTGLQGGWRQGEDGVELRFPWQVGQAVPVVSRFCLGQPGDGWWRLLLRAETTDQ